MENLLLTPLHFKHMDIASRVKLYKNAVQMHAINIEKAFEQQGFITHTPSDVLQQVLEGQYDVWLSDSSLMLVEVLEYPRLCTYAVFIAVGKIEDFVNESVHTFVEARAKSLGCSHIIAGGRPGWSRALEKFGYKLTTHTSVKEL